MADSWERTGLFSQSHQSAELGMAKYLKINISLHYKLDISSLSSSDFGIIICIMDILSRLKFCLVPALSNRNSHLIGYQDLICCILNYSQKDFFFSMHCDNLGAYPRGKKKKKKRQLIPAVLTYSTSTGMCFTRSVFPNKYSDVEPWIRTSNVRPCRNTRKGGQKVC